MLKKINPEDLVVGKKYLVEMEYRNDRRNGDFPLVFFDVMGARNVLPAFQPIYTLEQDQPIIATLEQSDTDTELEMLVNVASRLYAPHLEITVGNAEIITGKKPPSDPKENMNYWIEVNAKLATLTALDLITACKKIKEGER